MILQCPIGGKNRTACSGLATLPFSKVLAQLTRFGDCDVRAETDHDIAVLRHVVRERHEACLANKRRAADAAHGEALAPVLRERVRRNGRE